MKSETKSCQNCKKDFNIESDDFNFYEKIKVPPPTFCADCRFQRRLSFRNERHLYKRNCDLCKESIIALYPAEAPFPVYCSKCWYSDGWDSGSFGKDYDPSKNFFKQWHELMLQVPRPALIEESTVNCHYVNFSGDLKNCYFVVGCAGDEDCAFVYRTFKSKNSYDCFGLQESDLCYENIQSSKGFKANFAYNSESALESTVVTDCKNVSYCLGCINLRNQKYYYLNQPISEDEYNKKREELGSFSALEKLKEEAKELFPKVPHRFARIIMSSNSTGDDLVETKDCHNCFFVRKSENLKNAAFCAKIKDSRDFNHADNAELVYESENIEQNYNKLFSTTCWFSSHISYSDTCMTSQELFGCISMRSKSYCILNKQYSKEEYQALKEQIMKDMDSMPYTDSHGVIYTYGEFFPSELSPFAYNETLAQEYFPLTKTGAEKRGFVFIEDTERNYTVTKETKDLPDHIKDVNDSILQDIIACQHSGKCSHQCTSAFRLIPQEYAFYKQANMPLPRLCPNCRHYERLLTRNPLKLWHRNCMNEGCDNEFQTSYAPDRKEVIYCESCYQKEVA